MDPTSRYYPIAAQKRHRNRCTTQIPRRAALSDSSPLSLLRQPSVCYRLAQCLVSVAFTQLVESWSCAVISPLDAFCIQARSSQCSGEIISFRESPSVWISGSSTEYPTVEMIVVTVEGIPLRSRFTRDIVFPSALNSEHLYAHNHVGNCVVLMCTPCRKNGHRSTIMNALRMRNDRSDLIGQTAECGMPHQLHTAAKERGSVPWDENLCSSHVLQHI